MVRGGPSLIDDRSHQAKEAKEETTVYVVANNTNLGQVSSSVNLLPVR